MSVVSSESMQVSQRGNFRLRTLRWLRSDNADCDSGRAITETGVSGVVRCLAAHYSIYLVLRIQSIPLTVWRSLVTVILVLILTSYLSKLVWLMISPASTSFGFLSANTAGFKKPVNESLLAVTGSSEFQYSAVVSPAQLKQLQGLQLFGLADAKTTPHIPIVPDVEDKAIDTKLNLMLSGVIEGGLHDNSRAIINSGNHQALYAPGDFLPLNGKAGGKGHSRDISSDKSSEVRLVKIMPGRVILDNRGTYESLWLYQDRAATTSSSVSHAVSHSPGLVINSPQAPINAPRKSISTAIPSQKTVPSQKAITLDRVIKFSMARKSGEVIGYKIKPGHNRQLFEQLGLQSNDIVVSVNGMNLNSSAKAMEVYRDLRGHTSASLEILRAGKPLNLYVDIRQLEG